MARIKKCEKCGSFNEQDSEFCEKCGNSLKSKNIEKSNQNDNNKSKCPFCGLEIPPNVSKCGHCGEWIDKSKNNTPIIIAYVVTFLGIAINMFTYVPNPGAYIIMCILTLLPPFVVTGYLLTRKESKYKKHGVVLLIILIIFVILCYIAYLGTVQQYEINQRMDEMRRLRYRRLRYSYY